MGKLLQPTTCLLYKNRSILVCDFNQNHIRIISLLFLLIISLMLNTKQESCEQHPSFCCDSTKQMSPDL